MGCHPVRGIQRPIGFAARPNDLPTKRTDAELFLYWFSLQQLALVQGWVAKIWRLGQCLKNSNSVKLLMRFRKICILCLPLLSGLTVSAEVIDQYAPAAEPFINSQAPGQAVTTPAGGPWANIQFSWFNSSTGGRLAEGNLYLLSIAYADTPANLGPSTTGLIAIGTVSGGGVGTAYTFDSSVVLQPNTQYFFYSDNRPGGSGAVDFESPATYAGGSRYGSPNGTGNFLALAGAYSFVLEGTQVPEATTTVSLGVALAGLVGFRWFFQRQNKRN